MRRKVLLADDSLSIQKMFGLYLEKCEIDVVTMSNGEMAVSRLSTIQPDLILADVFMPGRTGYEVCEYVKQHPDFKHIPVLLLTGKFEPYDAQEAKRVKADGHIVKPIAEQEFVSLVRTTLERTAPKPAPPPVAQTQVLGSLTPTSVTPAAKKEPSALGNNPPRFHFGGPLSDPLSETPPPTIKVSPSLLDDGRLSDLEPLLPLDAPPPPAPETDSTDFILDLPPPDQAPPVLSYPEPPKTLSAPIPRPTFSQTPPPDFGTTTAKLDPAELPELLAAPPPSVIDTESPLELDDTSMPVAAPPPPAKAEPVAAFAAEPPFTITPPEAVEAPGTVVHDETPATVDEAAATAAPTDEVRLADNGSSVTDEPISAPVPEPEPMITPPMQVAPPWTPPQPVETATPPVFEVRSETSSFTPMTSPLETAPTSSLMNEPVPPPDFLAGMVSTPPADEPLMRSVETTVDAPIRTEATSGPVEPATAAAMEPPPPVFEVVMEDEPPVRGTDLLPDELLAIRERQRAQAEAIADEPTQAGTFVEAETPPAPVEVPVASPEAAADYVETEAPAMTFTPTAPEAPSAPAFIPAPFSVVTPVADLPAPTETVAEPVPEGLDASAADGLTGQAAPPDAAPSASLTDAVEDAPTPVFAPTPLEPATLPPPAPVTETPVGETATTEATPTAGYIVEPAAMETEATATHAATAETEDLTQPMPTTGTSSIAPAAEVAVDPSPTLVDWSSFALPPSLMDDIVRRVVAEISDRVVREIAWEVVPDLAELLIKKHLANGNGRRDSNA